MRPHPQAGRAVPQGLWAGECLIPGELSWTTSKAVLASELGGEVGSKQKETFFLSLLLFFSFHIFFLVALFYEV